MFRVTVDYRNAAVVRAAIRLANELGLEVIAEGVETEAQVRFLMGAGCEQAQGYYFSRPVTVLHATELLRMGRIEPAVAAPLPRVASCGRQIAPSALGTAQRVEAAAVSLGWTRSARSRAVGAWSGASGDLRRKVLVKRPGQAPPGRAARKIANTRTTESLPSNVAVTTSPAWTSRLAFSARMPLIRTLPASISRARPRPRLDKPCAPQPFVEALPRHRPSLSFLSGWRAARLSPERLQRGEGRVLGGTPSRSGSRAGALPAFAVPPWRFRPLASRRGLWPALLVVAPVLALRLDARSRRSSP